MSVGFFGFLVADDQVHIVEDLVLFIFGQAFKLIKAFDHFLVVVGVLAFAEQITNDTSKALASLTITSIEGELSSRSYFPIITLEAQCSWPIHPETSF